MNKTIFAVVLAVVVALAGLWVFDVYKKSHSSTDVEAVGEKSSAVDTSAWQTFEPGAGRGMTMPPYNFTLKYPANFGTGVDIGALTFFPAEQGTQPASSPGRALLVIQAFPDYDNLGPTEEAIAKQLKDVVLTGRSIMVDGYKALELASTDPSNKGRTWTFSTYPDTIPYDLGSDPKLKDIPPAPLLVSISSSLENDPTIPKGTTEAMIASIKLVKKGGN